MTDTEWSLEALQVEAKKRGMEIDRVLFIGSRGYALWCSNDNDSYEIIEFDGYLDDIDIDILTTVEGIDPAVMAFAWHVQ